MPQDSQDPSQTQWRRIVSEDDRTLAARWRAIKKRFRTMPRWTRYASIALLLCFGITALYLSSTSESSRLQMICQHNFHAARLVVKVDGEEVFNGNLGTASPAGKKHAGVLAKNVSGAESFSSLVDVPAGRHEVQVHIVAPTEAFDQERSVTADFIPEQEDILTINATRRNALTVSVEAPHVQAEAISHSLPKGGSTIIFSILGTMLSASVSFMVQEFWRSHKNRISASQ